MTQAAPPAQHRLAVHQFPRRDLFQHAQHVQIGEFGVVLAGCSRAIQNHGDQTAADKARSNFVTSSLSSSMMRLPVPGCSAAARIASAEAAESSATTAPPPPNPPPDQPPPPPRPRPIRLPRNMPVRKPVNPPPPASATAQPPQNQKEHDKTKDDQPTGKARSAAIRIATAVPERSGSSRPSIPRCASQTVRPRPATLRRSFPAAESDECRAARRRHIHP